MTGDGAPSAPRLPVTGAPAPTPAGWPQTGLDVEMLRARGWRPVALREFVLKVHQRCNLACDYCYVYTMADQSWRDRPRTMRRDIWRAAARRIAEHATAHDLPHVRVVLHGGEPLLLGHRQLAALLTDLRAGMPAGTRLSIGIQTNGVLLNDRTLGLLHEHQVSVGVSLDGDQGAHDRHRLRADGTGSFTQVAAALDLLRQPAHRTRYAGLLSTVDLRTDPVGCYESLLAFAPPAIDFLLPHANWQRPPWRPAGAPADAYGRWLIAVFDRWFDAPVRETGIRLLDEIVHLVLGGRGHTEHVGLSPSGVAVVETDGAIEQVDSLKSAYQHAAATGLNVLHDPFGAALAHPGIVARQIGTAALSDGCRVCPLHRVCGGGHYPHRYRPGSGFRNPTVYCADLFTLISHVRERVAAGLGPSAAEAPR